MLNRLVVVGVNHDSASVELREQIAFAPEKVPDSLGALIRDTQLSESVILSTCNRTELYGVLPEGSIMFTIVYILFTENLDGPTAGTRVSRKASPRTPRLSWPRTTRTLRS